MYMHNIYFLQLLKEYYKDYISLNDHFCKSATHISIALYCLTVLHNTTIALERYNTNVLRQIMSAEQFVQLSKKSKKKVAKFL